MVSGVIGTRQSTDEKDRGDDESSDDRSEHGQPGLSELEGASNPSDKHEIALAVPFADIPNSSGPTNQDERDNIAPTNPFRAQSRGPGVPFPFTGMPGSRPDWDADMIDRNPFATRRRELVPPFPRSPRSPKPAK
ncbi:hypothetical protein FVE85_8658 [Porphyridium purpureum]|uniref:Uncharacterized protein n=1 Tax=Porphyridium purpureum TaxID=35688 RepID=A0A5J4YR02_PORPP|nr:hypothetical protein FVE85_8658 [Porphyridium purpureum]|eukprot:POR9671..scf296_7